MVKIGALPPHLLMRLRQQLHQQCHRLAPAMAPLLAARDPPLRRLECAFGLALPAGTKDACPV
jgi:hypothetical protein